jgi:hypothetical protein
MNEENKNNGAPLAVKLADLQIIKDYIDGKVKGVKEEVVATAKEYTDGKAEGVIRRKTLWSMSDPDNGELAVYAGGDSYSTDGILEDGQTFQLTPRGFNLFSSNNWIEVVYSIQPYIITESYGNTNKNAYQKRVLFRRMSDGGAEPIEETIGVGHTMRYTQNNGFIIKYYNDDTTVDKLYIHEVNELY